MSLLELIKFWTIFFSTVLLVGWIHLNWDRHTTEKQTLIHNVYTALGWLVISGFCFDLFLFLSWKLDNLFERFTQAWNNNDPDPFLVFRDAYYSSENPFPDFQLQRRHLHSIYR